MASPYGDYALHISMTDDGYAVERRLTLKSLGVPIEEYGSLKSFLEEVRRLDGTQLIFDDEGEE